jgi:hypothetical protein
MYVYGVPAQSRDPFLASCLFILFGGEVVAIVNPGAVVERLSDSAIIFAPDLPMGETA